MRWRERKRMPREEFGFIIGSEVPRYAEIRIDSEERRREGMKLIGNFFHLNIANGPLREIYTVLGTE
jgi:hypothetical protein